MQKSNDLTRHIQRTEIQQQLRDPSTTPRDRKRLAGSLGGLNGAGSPARKVAAIKAAKTRWSNRQVL